VLDLCAQQPLIHRYWHDTTVQMSDFKNEGVVASECLAVSGQRPDQRETADRLDHPEEGATGWADTTMLHAEAKHPNCAYKWMDWSLQPKVQGDVAAWFGSLPAVPAACKERTARRRRLQDQRLRPVRQDRLLENPAG
jgi:putative spermidine/putrescine transport system substrate-binding protein